jgi:SAM-dependent methyltransferase
MRDPAPTSYDEIPYDSKPRYATHPDCLATLATLLGMQPAPVNRCRVLELGCATGGNLLPMAEAYPDSQFVGIDLSAVQIDAGRKVAQALGLDNLRLQMRSILDVDADFGQFDYIIAHGVYSWVPADVRDRILHVCKHNLAPNGVAYVSYNTYPGWHLRAPVREMMSFHVRGLADPHERPGQARALLHFLAASAPHPEGTWGRLLRDEADLLRGEKDYYLFHEHLESDNHPVYFHQFMEHAGRHGLQYLGEAMQHTTLSIFPAEVQETLRRISPDLLHLEQYLDFLKNRTFRRTLLVHDHVVLQRAPGPGVVFGLSATAMARPASASPDIASAAIEEFHNDDGATVSTNAPLGKAALVVLFEAWPRAVPFDELFALARQRLGDAFPDVPEDHARALLGWSLAHLYLSNLVGLHVGLPDFVVAVSERPRATPLTRLQARSGALITNRRHRLAELSGLDRGVLGFLDGRRDRPALVEALTEAVLSGELGLTRDGALLTAPDAVRAVIGAELEGCLQRLAQSALLVG